MVMMMDPERLFYILVPGRQSLFSGADQSCGLLYILYSVVLFDVARAGYSWSLSALSPHHPGLRFAHVTLAHQTAIKMGIQEMQHGNSSLRCPAGSRGATNTVRKFLDTQASGAGVVHGLGFAWKNQSCAHPFRREIPHSDL